MNSNQDILYDFPKLPSQKINSIFSGNIQYSVVGKENRPNIFLVKKSQKRGFVSKSVYIFSNIHNIGGDVTPCSGELVVEHDAITNGGKKLYLCVPLITHHYNGIYGSPNILDELIQDSKSVQEIELNSVLPNKSECYYYETSAAFVVVFKTAVAVQSHFTGFSQGDIEAIKKPFLETSKYDTLSASKMGTSAPGFSSVISSTNTPETKSTVGANYQEGFTEGPDSSKTAWMECDNVDLDYSQEVPTYAASMGSNLTDPNTMINFAIWTVLIVIGFMAFIMGFPRLYFSAISISGSNEWPMALVIVCFVIGIILLGNAIPALVNKENNANDILISASVFMSFSVAAIIYLTLISIPGNEPYLQRTYTVKTLPDEFVWGRFRKMVPILTEK